MVARVDVADIKVLIKVILVRSTEPMSSLKVRITFVPSADVRGALRPVATSVGFTPSTLCAACAATVVWVRLASEVVLPAARIVPPFSASVFPLIATPAGAASFAATS